MYYTYNTIDSTEAEQGKEEPINSCQQGNNNFPCMGKPTRNLFSSFAQRCARYQGLLKAVKAWFNDLYIRVKKTFSKQLNKFFYTYKGT